MRRGIRYFRSRRFHQRRRQLWQKRIEKAWEAWQEEGIDLDAEEFDDWLEPAEDVMDAEFVEIDDSGEDEDTDLTALETVFSDMQGKQKELLPDGRPRVDSVIGRLRARGLPGKVNRKSIDDAFAKWKRKKGAD